MVRSRFGVQATEPAIILTRRPAVQAYGVAVSLVLLACAVTLLLHIWFTPAPVTPFLAAVAFAAWYGGIGPALLAVVLSLVPVGVALEPYGDWALSDSDRAALALFVLVSALLLLLSVSRDRAETALRAGEQRLAAILDQLPLGVSVVDRKGHLDLQNPPMRRLVPEATISLDPERLHLSRIRAPDGAPLDAAEWPPTRALRGEPVVGDVEFLVSDDHGRESLGGDDGGTLAGCRRRRPGRDRGSAGYRRAQADGGGANRLSRCLGARREEPAGGRRRCSPSSCAAACSKGP